MVGHPGAPAESQGLLPSDRVVGLAEWCFQGASLLPQSACLRAAVWTWPGQQAHSMDDVQREDNVPHTPGQAEGESGKFLYPSHFGRAPGTKYITYYEDSASRPGQRTAVWELDKGVRGAKGDSTAEPALPAGAGQGLTWPGLVRHGGLHPAVVHGGPAACGGCGRGAVDHRSIVSSHVLLREVWLEMFHESHPNASLPFVRKGEAHTPGPQRNPWARVLKPLRSTQKHSPDTHASAGAAPGWQITASPCGTRTASGTTPEPAVPPHSTVNTGQHGPGERGETLFCAAAAL